MTNGALAPPDSAWLTRGRAGRHTRITTRPRPHAPFGRRGLTNQSTQPRRMRRTRRAGCHDRRAATGTRRVGFRKRFTACAYEWTSVAGSVRLAGASARSTCVCSGHIDTRCCRWQTRRCGPVSAPRARCRNGGRRGALASSWSPAPTEPDQRRVSRTGHLARQRRPLPPRPGRTSAAR